VCELNLEPNEKATLIFVLVEWLEKNKSEEHILHGEVIDIYNRVVKA
jgi:hypothetical protein